MAFLKGRTCSLFAMIALTGSFFLVELIFGYISNSLALIGDSYHMLSDLVALVVGLASVRISKWSSKSNTYGWARAEVVGALVNAVFLIALCFTIFCEAVERLLGDVHVLNPNMMLIVGAIGLAINLCGLVLFGRHNHHHSHGHSHANESDTASNGNRNEVAVDSDDDDGEAVSLSTPVPERQLNMRGVFLHVLGDALGSVIVIISALVIKYAVADWKYKVDPILSIVLVVIIVCTAIPLLKESTMILLQTAPNHIEVHTLKEKLLQNVQGVLGLHEFHIWQLTGNRIIVSAHIRCLNPHKYMKVAEDLKAFFHKEGIHSTTIQPEFVETASQADTEASVHTCLLNCTSASCAHYRCCPLSSADMDTQSPRCGGTALKVASTPACPTVTSPLTVPTNGTMSTSNPELISAHKSLTADSHSNGPVLRPSDTVVTILPDESASAIGL